MLLLCCRVSALNPSLDLSQYAHTAWTHREGLMGSAQSIAQTSDGYLWLGTEFGLVRFDGVRFFSWTPPAGERLPSSDIMALLAAHDDTLWIGTSDGLASFNNGRLLLFPKIAAEPVFALLEDREGVVWVGLRGRVCAIRNGNTECSDDRHLLGGVGVFSLFEDSDSSLWAGEAESGLWRWRPGPPERVLPNPINTSQALAQGDHGTGLIAVGGGTLRQVFGRNTEEYAIPGTRQPYALHVLRDRNGGLWIGTWQQGLLHVYEGKTTRFGRGDGLTSETVTALFEDREGDIWVGTTNGIDRFRESVVSTISENRAWSVLAARDGSLWIGTQDGVNNWRQGQMTIYRSPTGPKTPSSGEVKGAPREITDSGLPDNKVGSLFEDQRGRIWVTTRKGAAWFENGRFTRARRSLPVGAASTIFADQHDGVWISYPAYGLFHVVEGKVIESARWPWSDRNDPRLSAVISDPAKGGLWVGFKHEGLAYLSGYQMDKTLSDKDGLGAGRVWNLQLDHEGTLWAATEGGLSRIKDGRVATLTTHNGLPCDAVHWVIEDDALSLWLYTACGLLHITRPELEAWASDPKRAIQSTIFDGADGVGAHALLSPYTPVVTKSTDGKLWFAHLDGVSVIDPRHLPFNKVPPPVHIEQITADGKGYQPASSVRLPPRTRDLAVDYTALSLAAPEMVHFRFKLEPQDQDWREVVNQRRVEYSNLPPGSYRFRVTASNNSGVWNEAGDSLDFSIDPAYYQTRWFQASCVAAVLAVLWGLYRYRLHRIAQEFNVRLDERVNERTRIARELHDTLLQSFQGLALHFQAVDELLPASPGDAKEELEKALERADQAIVEGREAIQGLRSETMACDDLAQAVTALGGELASDDPALNAARFGVIAEGSPPNLHPILRDEIYRIAREAVRNAFRHAQARAIEAEITYGERLFRLRIRDDGCGIDPGIVEEGRAGHYGLPGMRERATRIGGHLNVWTAAGAGTEIELTIPASIAYGISRAGFIQRLKSVGETWWNGVRAGKDRRRSVESNEEEL